MPYRFGQPDWMNYLRHSTDIVAYDYQADTFCPDCVKEIAGHATRMDLSGMTAEDALSTWADAIDVNRADERSFDQSYFPKVVFASQIEGDKFCGSCHEKL